MKIGVTYSLEAREARWLSGRASDSGVRGRGFETNLRHIVSLSKTLYSPKVLVIPRKRWLCPDVTKKLLTGTLNLNTKKQTNKTLLEAPPEPPLKRTNAFFGVDISHLCNYQKYFY